MLLQIEHTTAYRYAEPVRLGTHRLMLRPMEGHDVQIRSSALRIQPEHKVRWVHDAFDNSIALVDFPAPASALRIESRVTVEQFNTNPFDFVLDSCALQVPFTYPAGEAPDLSPYQRPGHPADEAAVRDWLKPFLGAGGKAATLDLLIALNRSVPLYFQYSRREEIGVRSPATTLRERSGSCRDFALLLMEAARHLGIAARYVSGYLCDSGSERIDAASNATHAWAELYLPGAGWRGFDPTCGVLAADMHVRVAVAREPGQAVPVSGSFAGPASAFCDMLVTVNASAVKKGS
jgi:transglutaminase-like putative cysteine protease